MKSKWVRILKGVGGEAVYFKENL